MPQTTIAATVPPTLLWLRRDLRLGDHPGWEAALAAGGPVIPVFILDPLVESEYGAAPLWRLGESLRDLAARLASRGSRLILRRSEALEVLRQLLAETNGRRVVWSRLYDPRAIKRDTAIKAALGEDGVEVTSVNASLLFEPWTVKTGQGSFYKVYTPFWASVRNRDVGDVLPEPGDLAPPMTWPRSDQLSDWSLGRQMHSGAVFVRQHARIGQAAAHDRLSEFLDDPIARYRDDRDRLDREATSGLSENLTYGEISPRQIWAAGRNAMERLPGKITGQAEHFLKELVWREFAYHLLFHTPWIETRSWRPDWNNFAWRPDNADAERWRRGMTGVPVIDAAMRQLYVTGTIHNRARMLVASFLTKHLLTDWRVGAAWFRDCLIDWDPAANAMGWQWVAGSGPDAAPYFRVFNPDTQAAKFDPDSRYRDRFLAEGRLTPHADALGFFGALPRSWKLTPAQPYPEPVIRLNEGRERALSAYAHHRDSRS